MLLLHVLTVITVKLFYVKIFLDENLLDEKKRITVIISSNTIYIRDIPYMKCNVSYIYGTNDVVVYIIIKQLKNVEHYSSSL